MPRAPSSRARATTRPTARGRCAAPSSAPIENPLAKAVLAGEFTRGDTVRVDVRDGALVFEKVAAEPIAHGKGHRLASRAVQATCKTTGRCAAVVGRGLPRSSTRGNPCAAV